MGALDRFFQGDCEVWAVLMPVQAVVVVLSFYGLLNGVTPGVQATEAAADFVAAVLWYHTTEGGPRNTYAVGMGTLAVLNVVSLLFHI
jgi:hypothetical protein